MSNSETGGNTVSGSCLTVSSTTARLSAVSLSRCCLGACTVAGMRVRTVYPGVYGRAYIPGCTPTMVPREATLHTHTGRHVPLLGPWEACTTLRTMGG